MNTIGNLIVVTAMLLAAHAAFAEELVEIESPRGVSQRFLLDLPDQTPIAILVLFAGGKGALNLGKGQFGPSIKWGKNNFLVRTRRDFARRGFIVVTVDAPSDKQGASGMFGGFRTSRDHVTDIDSVIARARDTADLPVWLIGTSRGTESAAYLGINSKKKPAGIVLASSMTEHNAKGNAVTELPLQRISVATLIVHHRNDGCKWTTPEGAERIRSMLTSAPVVELDLFDGGREQGKPCSAMSHHGYLGIEEEVVNAIAAFVRAHS